MRLPLIWRPARSTKPTPSVVHAPVSLVSLAATFLTSPGSPRRRGSKAALPLDDADAERRSFEATFTEWDSSIFGVDVHVRSVVTDEYLYTEYQPGTSTTAVRANSTTSLTTRCSASTDSTTGIATVARDAGRTTREPRAPAGRARDPGRVDGARLSRK